ncbi:hypothetical protein ACWC09_48155 [Streptomyces sp. NPDC001617]
MSEVCRFIRAEKANYPIVLLCRVLHVARSSYYAWREGEAARHARRAAAAPTVSRASTPNCGVWGGG